MAWVQDVRFVSESSSSPSTPLGIKFKKSMTLFLETLNVSTSLLSIAVSGLGSPHPLYKNLDNLLDPYDFAAITVSLVPSIPGKHEGWPNVLRVGHTGLMTAVKDVGALCPPRSVLDIEYQVSLIRIPMYYIIT